MKNIALFRRAVAGLLAALLLAAPGLCHKALASGHKLTVFAAASTTNALSEIGLAFQKMQGVKVINSFASSSTLAKQIERGAPAGVYVSANVKWMDYLEKAKLLAGGTRFDLLRNRLVLIAPANTSPDKARGGSALDLPRLLHGGRLALGDPAHVPAGIYAKQALINLGIWDGVKNHLAATPNVRAALALVETGEAPLGVVYATDAAISRKVKVLVTFPGGSHRPIVYPAALIKENLSPEAAAYLDFLRGDQARRIFAKYGFLTY